MKEIFERRSVRSYRKEPISEENISLLLKAAMRAPSAGNEQPWDFVVLRDRANMLKILEFHPYAHMVEEADCVIVVCGNPQLQKFPDQYWVQDCSAATQNLLLEATHLGIGAVWMGVYPIQSRVDGLRKLIGAPDHIIPMAGIALGYPKEMPEPVDSFRPERVHRETW